MLMLNNRDPRPLYEQVRDSFRTLILNGALASDEKLPSVRELAKQLAINPNTIQRAYRELEQLGLIYTVAGKGAFVASGDAAAQQRKDELMKIIRTATQELKELGASCQDVTAVIAEVFVKEDEA